MRPRVISAAVKIGATLNLAVLIFLLLAYMRRERAFEGVTVFGTGDTKEISAGIREALTFELIGFSLGAVGLCLLMWTIFFRGARERWTFRWALLSGVPRLLAFPIGSAVGVTFMALVAWKRQDALSEGRGRANKAVDPTPGTAPENSGRSSED